MLHKSRLLHHAHIDTQIGVTNILFINFNELGLLVTLVTPVTPILHARAPPPCEVGSTSEETSAETGGPDELRDIWGREPAHLE